MIEPERIVWRSLRSALPGHHWRKQMPFGPYIVDFCSHSARLIIEVDGGQHAVASDQDAARTAFLASEGYRVLRFWNNDVLSNTDGVLQRITEELKASPLVGEVGGGPAASAAEAFVEPPPNPPHKGEGLGQPEALQ